MLDESLTVGTICKRNVKNFSVFNCLLHPASDRFACVFGLNNGDWLIIMSEQKIVCPLLCLAVMYVSIEYDTTVREGIFHTDVLLVPPFLLNGRSDIAVLYVLFCQALIYHSSTSITSDNTLLSEVTCKITKISLTNEG